MDIVVVVVITMRSVFLDCDDGVVYVVGCVYICLECCCLLVKCPNG